MKKASSTFSLDSMLYYIIEFMDEDKVEKKRKKYIILKVLQDAMKIF